MAIKQILRLSRRQEQSPAAAAATPRLEVHGKESKAQRLLGLSQSDMANVRKQSACSSINTRYQSVAFSDATTEFDFPINKDCQTDFDRASVRSISIHLPEQSPESQQNSTHDCQDSESASDLNVFYDRAQVPLAVSQQTSESSRRDFALRKGRPNAVGSEEQDRDYRRQHRLLKTHHSRNSLASKNFEVSSSLSLRSKGSVKRHQKKGSGEHSLEPVGSLQSTKIHIKKPVRYSQHWFEALDDESSTDEVEEPPEILNNLLVPDFYLDLNDSQHHIPDQSCMEDFSILLSQPELLVKSNTIDEAFSLPGLPTTLHASLGKSRSRRSKRKSQPISQIDLTQNSVLYLSSSEDSESENEDDDDIQERESLSDFPPSLSGSIASINNKTMNCDNYEEDVLTAFPPTPNERSNRVSYIDHSPGDTPDDASVESRTMMQVTRQEESLLAAMRLKKAAMKRASAILQQNELESDQSLTDTPQIRTIVHDHDTLSQPNVLGHRLEYHSIPRARHLSQYSASLNSPATSGVESFHSIHTPGSLTDRHAWTQLSYDNPSPLESTQDKGNAKVHGMPSNSDFITDRDERQTTGTSNFDDWSFKGLDSRMGLGITH